MLLLCFLFYSLVVLPVTEAEKVNAIIGLFGWSATIYAPIAAYILLDNWKDQAKYNEQINCLTAIHKNLHDIRNNIINIREQDNFFISIN